MIIICPNCKKKFKIDTSQIPAKGRNLQCGSCDHIWFYKTEDKSSETLTLNDDLFNNEIETKLKPLEKEKNFKKPQQKQKSTIKVNEEKSESKFFANLMVCIISIVALIILIDTLKKPLINIFPGSEIILLNLFETLKDIKLFIIDLFN